MGSAWCYYGPWVLLAGRQNAPRMCPLPIVGQGGEEMGTKNLVMLLLLRSCPLASLLYLSGAAAVADAVDSIRVP